MDSFPFLFICQCPLSMDCTGLPFGEITKKVRQRLFYDLEYCLNVFNSYSSGYPALRSQRQSDIAKAVYLRTSSLPVQSTDR